MSSGGEEKEKEKDGPSELLSKLSLKSTDPASPKTPSFDKKLTSEEAEGYKKAKFTFDFCKKGAKTQASFNSIYAAAENPFELALKFHVQGVNHQDCKSKSFTFFVLEAFKEFIKDHPEKNPDDCLKLTAFHLTNKDPNGTLFHITSVAFRFAESSHLFDDYVQELIKEHNYISAAQVAQYTGLADESFLDGFAVPLSFSRDKADVLYKYLSSEAGKSLKVPFMRLLDTMMQEEKVGDSLRKRMARYKGIPVENLSYDYLRKNIPKLRKSLEMAMDATPFSSRNELISALVFKVVFWIKKLVEGQTTPNIFEIKIKSLISKENTEGQLILLGKLINYNLDLECLKWVLFFNVNVQQLPGFIQRRIDFVVQEQMRQMDDHRRVAQQNREYMDHPPPPIRKMEQQQHRQQHHDYQGQGENYNNRSNNDFLF